MVQNSKTCFSVNEFIAVLKSLRLSEYTTQFNLDGTWTIHYTDSGRTSSGKTSSGRTGAARKEDLTSNAAVSSKAAGISTRAVV